MDNELSAATAQVLGAPIEFSTAGAISAGDRQAIVDLFDKVLAPVGEPVSHVRVRMEHGSDRNRSRTTTVRAVIDLRGGAIRGHVTADTTRGAIDKLEDRLRVQLRHRSERRKAQQHRGPTSGPGEWRHGDLPVQRPGYHPLPADERQVVRHKTVAPAASTVEEALFDVEMMDYDFYLFVDIETDEDALVVRSGGIDGVSPSVQYLSGIDESTLLDGIAVDHRPAPGLDLAAAKERVDVSDEPRLFFRDIDTGRGHVLYRRFDGHYGLIVPADTD